jgi:pyruvate dehydrogenase E1 component
MFMTKLRRKGASAMAPNDLAVLATIEQRLLWLSAWTIHHANHLRDSRDGLKVGGHQASCASMTTLMTALYFKVLRPQDRVAVKPHASPVFHAIQTLFGRQTVDQLKAFRAFGGAQSYPSRTKDRDDVDFSTGSVGLGVAITAFASLVQDYLCVKNRLPPERCGRMIALLGDAELDEGNIYEALIECYKHDVRNTWWIVDYNRQSLDATTSERMFDRFDDIFATSGWGVETLKFGRRQRDIFARPGGAALREWIEACPNDLYAALTFEGGSAWRERLLADLQTDDSRALIGSLDDTALADVMTTLGGHCLETLLECFERCAVDDRPKLIIAYTIKGWRLPFQGHKDNHAGLMTPAQMSAFQARVGVPEGCEWDAFAGLSPEHRAACEALVEAAPFAVQTQRRFSPAAIDVPPWPQFPCPDDQRQSTQAAFGKILVDLARADTPLSAALVTTSPDVTVSTNLGGFVNRRGLFARSADEDVFKSRRIASPQTWAARPDGQHIELGIAENNLFLMLAALGLSSSLFGQRLLPIGTLYDPFIARGLDALNYACYQDARFILAATPSGLTLGPEGGAHQSVATPLIGMGQPGLTSFEPAFADELALMLRQALIQIQDPVGDSVYLRLSTRQIEQPVRTDDAWTQEALKGAYWLRKPARGAGLAIAYCGAIAPEAFEAWQSLQEDAPGAGLLAVTSPDLLHRDWTAAGRSRWTHGSRATSHAETLLGQLDRNAGLITMLDGAPGALSWLGAVCGHRVRALGVEQFGQAGDLPDLYRVYRLDAAAVLDAAADLMLG